MVGAVVVVVVVVVVVEVVVDVDVVVEETVDVVEVVVVGIVVVVIDGAVVVETEIGTKSLITKHYYLQHSNKAILVNVFLSCFIPSLNLMLNPECEVAPSESEVKYRRTEFPDEEIT